MKKKKLEFAPKITQSLEDFNKLTAYCAMHKITVDQLYNEITSDFMDVYVNGWQKRLR
jgi:hypothetical protein